MSYPCYAIPPRDEIPEQIPDRELRLYNEKTREKLDVVYHQNGQYIDDSVGQLNYFMRDLHVNKSYLMDLALYDFMHKLHRAIDTRQRIHVLSGYRTNATNVKLKESLPWVAKKSLHVQGRAVDLYIPGIDPDTIQRAARKLRLGGVGHYASAGFVHIDTGYPRHWQR